MSASEVANESPTVFSGPRQLHIAKRQLLARLTGQVAVGGVAKFHVDNPDSRCQLRVSIVSDSVVDLFVNGMGLWVAGAEYDQGGPSGELFPHTNLDGEQGTPVAFPRTAGLHAWSREFVTSADAIMGELTIPGIEGPAGSAARLYVTARVQPAGQRLPWPEWDEVRRSLKIFIDQRITR